MSTPDSPDTPSTPSTPTPAEKAKPVSTTTVSDDAFTNPDVALLTVSPTVLGEDGIRRLTSPPADAWTPAPTELSAEEIQNAEDREAYFAAAGEATDKLTS